MSDPINRPAHYNFSAVEPIKAIEAWGLGFSLGNAVKYIARASHKGAQIQDLEKARWYLDREIARLKGPTVKEKWSAKGDTEASLARRRNRRVWRVDIRVSR